MPKVEYGEDVITVYAEFENKEKVMEYLEEFSSKLWIEASSKNGKVEFRLFPREENFDRLKYVLDKEMG